MKVITGPFWATVTPRSAAVTRRSTARDDCANATVASTSADVMARPSDQWWPEASVTL